MRFGNIAKSLSSNPLSLIALFIVLIYGIAALFFSFSSSNLNSNQKWPLLIFLVVFPIFVFGAFVWLVAKHPTNLYAPSDFQDETSFVRLNQKVELIEVRQRAAEVDPRGDIDSAYNALDELLETGQIEVASNLAKAFLKVKRFETSLTMFEKIINVVEQNDRLSLKISQYKAYSLIGLGRFPEALSVLNPIKQSGDVKLYDFWAKMAVAYCEDRLGNTDEVEHVLDSVGNLKEARDNKETVEFFYPELSERFKSKINILNI